MDENNLLLRRERKKCLAAVLSGLFIGSLDREGHGGELPPHACCDVLQDGEKNGLASKGGLGAWSPEDLPVGPPGNAPCAAEAA